MSKWVNTEKFEQFQKERANDSTENTGGNTVFARKWPNPVMGTQAKPKEYHTRLIPDLKGNFYKKFHYHMFQTGENWNFIMCPKTLDFETYCPWCHLTQVLYQGGESDKKRAYNYKRKDKFVGNVFIVKDPRDVDEQDPDKHFTGKTFLYEFPTTIEKLIKKEITDTENGWGFKIFDPEDGHNLIISIGAKAPDKSGKVWPDYSLTTFAKRPSSIGDNIDEIMDSTQDIMEYIESSMKTPEEHATLLKSEMVYDDVADQFERFMKPDKTEEKKVEESKAEKKQDKKTEPKQEKKTEPKDEESPLSDGDEDIDSLLDGL
jgi:hypothetical protein